MLDKDRSGLTGLFTFVLNVLNVFSFVFDIESIVDAFDIDASNIVDIVADIAAEHIVVDGLDIAVVDADQYFLAAADLAVGRHYCLHMDDNVHVQSAAVEQSADGDDHDLGCKLNKSI